MAKRDARSLNQEVQFELRRRAVDLKRDGYSHQEIADVLEVSKSAVRKWWRLYREQGKRGLKLGQRGRPAGSQRRLSPDQEKSVKKLIRDKTPDQLKMPFALWTRQAVGDLIESEFGIALPVRSVGNYLARWGFTPQRPRKRAYQQQPREIQKWLKNTYPDIEKRAKEENAEIHWGDETGVSSEDQRGRGYAPRGHTPLLEVEARRFSTSMISTVTNRGKVRFMVYEGALKTPLFIKFLKKLTAQADKKIFLILDNLRVHKAVKVREWVEAHQDQIELFFLPPYAPELNPDEYLNNTVKSQLKKRRTPRSKVELTKGLRSCMRSNQRRPSLIQNIFKHPAVRYAAA